MPHTPASRGALHRALPRIQSGRILFDTDGRRESAETGQRRLRNLLALGQQQELVLALHVGVDRHTWTKARQGKRPHFALRLLHMDRLEDVRAEVLTPDRLNAMVFGGFAIVVARSRSECWSRFPASS